MCRLGADQGAAQRHPRHQDRELARLAKTQADLPGRARILSPPLEQQAERHGFHRQQRRSEEHGRRRDLDQQHRIDRGANGKEEQDEKEIPQRPQGVGDVLGDRRVRKGYAGEDRAHFEGHPRHVTRGGDGEAPADRKQEHELVEGVEPGEQGKQHEPDAEEGGQRDRREGHDDEQDLVEHSA